MANVNEIEAKFIFNSNKEKILFNQLSGNGRQLLFEVSDIFDFLQKHFQILSKVEQISLNNAVGEFSQIFNKFLISLNNDGIRNYTSIDFIKMSESFEISSKLTDVIEEFYRKLYFPQVALNNSDYYIPVFNIYVRVKILVLNSEISGVSEAYKYSESLKKIFEDSKKVQEEINRVAADVVVKDYAEIFLNQAKTHSNFGKFSWANTDTDKFGLTQKWFFGTIALIILFFVFAMNIGKIIPLTGQNITQLTFSYITRVLSFSLFIYIITVSIKQFNIHQHLATINRNRANTLNTFTLFMNTIGKDDPAVRNAFILEVSKAIFDTMNTGFIAQKEGDASNSVTELIRYMTPTANK